MEKTLRQYLSETIKSILEEEDLKEFSGVGAIAGFSLPLGMAPANVPTPSVSPKKRSRKVKKKSAGTPGHWLRNLK